ncbi:DUF2062 domain-containing protein [Bartonella sp. DGB2]|uniref:DUF2062 domain-containing protein n=1 Tax=Bartonella sp. DGB2 TaxID=3388426 RepID=UPI00399013E3
MLFRRRDPVGFLEMVRLWLWPRRSFARSLAYMKKRILRIAATPHAIALGIGIGIFAACSPFFGFHLILAMALAWSLRANIAAAALTTVLSNPVTFLPIILLDYKLGGFIFSFFNHASTMSLAEVRQIFTQHSWTEAWHILLVAWDDVLIPILVGGTVMGLVLGTIAYILSYRTTYRFQERRRAKARRKAQ